MKLKAWWAGLSALVVAILVAIIVYSMPVGQALLSASEGAAFGLFPIMWIVVTALWIYNMTVAHRRVRGAATLVRRDLRRPARPGRDHRVLLRRAARGARRVRDARRDHRRHAHRARLPADEGGGGGPRREHRAGRVRRDRHPHRHPRRDHGAAQGGPGRHGRSPDAAAGAVRAADPHRHGRRDARHPPDLARCGRRRPRLRRRAVRDLELRLRRAHGHRGVPARDREHRPAAARVAALRAAARRGDRDPPRRWARPGRSRHARSRVRGGRPQATGGWRARHAARGRPRLRALPHHHRDLLPGADRADQGLPGVTHAGVHVAGSRRPQRGRRGGLVDHVRVQLAGRRRAPCCSSRASSRWSS